MTSKADLFYMSEKFGKAVRAMAVMDAPLKERVHAAYQSQAMLAHTVGGENPAFQPSAELLERMAALWKRVSQDGSFQTSFLVMSDQEVGDVAEEIVDIYLSIESEIAVIQSERRQQSD